MYECLILSLLKHGDFYSKFKIIIFFFKSSHEKRKGSKATARLPAMAAVAKQNCWLQRLGLSGLSVVCDISPCHSSQQCIDSYVIDSKVYWSLLRNNAILICIKKACQKKCTGAGARTPWRLIKVFLRNAWFVRFS